MITKVSKITQRAKGNKLFAVLYLLHKLMPYPVAHKIKNNDEETSKSKKNVKTKNT